MRYCSQGQLYQNIRYYIYSFYSQKSYKNLGYITYTHTDTHSTQYMHMYTYKAYGYASVHIYIIIYISTAILRENKTCRRLRALSSSS